MFVNCIKSSELSYDAAVRIRTLNALFTELVYSSVCQSLYERHKLLFSLLIASRIMATAGRLDPTEWRCVPCLTLDV